MLKRVLFDYIRSFTWKNIVQTCCKYNNGYSLWTIIYLTILLPLSNAMIHESGQAAASYYLWAIPFLIGMIGMELLPLQIPKLMFLCPLNDEERRQYMKCVYWVRILVPIMIQVLIGVVLFLSGILKSGIVVISAFSTLSALFVVSRVIKPGYPSDKHADKDMYYACYIICFMVCVIVQMCTAMFIEEIVNGSSVYKYVLLAEIITYIIMDMLCLRSLPQFIEKNSVYEERFDIVKSKNQAGKAR